MFDVLHTIVLAILTAFVLIWSLIGAIMHISFFSDNNTDSLSIRKQMQYTVIMGPIAWLFGAVVCIYNGLCIVNIHFQKQVDSKKKSKPSFRSTSYSDFYTSYDNFYDNGKTFAELHKLGYVSDVDIIKYINYYKNYYTNRFTVPIHDYLGMTEDQYVKHLQYPNIPLRKILNTEETNHETFYK